MKLQNVQAYPIKDVPSHLTKECSQLGVSLVLAIDETIKDREPNIILGAVSFLLSSMIKSLISDDIEEQKTAAKHSAIALIKNVYFLNGIDFDEENKK